MKKLIASFICISEILKFVSGKTCKFYPSYPEYGIVYSVDCYLGCCPIQFPKTAQSACCDRSLSWLWIVLPCFIGLAVIAIIVITVCIYLITRKNNKIQPRIINVESDQSYNKADVTINKDKKIKSYNDFMINPIPSYQVRTNNDDVMLHLPHNSMVSSRGYFIENESVY